MNLFIKVLLVALCAYTINCVPFDLESREPNLHDLQKLFDHEDIGLQVIQKGENDDLKNELTTLLAEQTRQEDNEKELSRSKRQLAVPLGFRSYDYGDYYGGLTGDYNYDYYDWVCSETRCRICNILGGECCDPESDPNCVLPDTCLNNPCLAGGSCVTTTTLLGNPDFLCICLPGLTGKYCQITNDYIVDGFMPNIPIGPAFPPHGVFPPNGPLPLPGPGPAPPSFVPQQPYGPPPPSFVPQPQYQQAPPPPPSFVPQPQYQQAPPPPPSFVPQPQYEQSPPPPPSFAPQPQYQQQVAPQPQFVPQQQGYAQQ